MKRLKLIKDKNSRKIWRCDKCGHCAEWGYGWAWYGTYDGIENILCPDCVPKNVIFLDRARQ